MVGKLQLYHPPASFGQMALNDIVDFFDILFIRPRLIFYFTVVKRIKFTKSFMDRQAANVFKAGEAYTV